MDRWVDESYRAKVERGGAGMKSRAWAVALCLVMVAAMTSIGAEASASATRLVQGVITSYPSTTYPGSGAIACPFVIPPPHVPDCSIGVATIALADSSGHYSMLVDPAVTYWVQGFADLGTFIGTALNSFQPAGTGDITVDLIVPFPGTTYTGTVSRTGYTTFPPQTAGVGACPQPPIDPTKTGADCIGLRFVFANPDGSYLLRLHPGDWNIAGFIIIDGVPIGTPTLLHASSGDNSNIVNRDFSADITTPDDGDGNPATASIPSPAPDGGTLALTAPDGTELTNVAAAPESKILTPPPAGTEFPYGVLSFTAGPVAPGSEVFIDITFPQTAPQAAQWYKVRAGVWAPYDDPATPGPDVTRPNDNTLRIRIVDGGFGDDDQTVNGYVTDPGALGSPPGPTNKDQCKNGGWRTGPYRNQGACVSHFAAHKK